MNVTIYQFYFLFLTSDGNLWPSCQQSFSHLDLVLCWLVCVSSLSLVCFILIRSTHHLFFSVYRLFVCSKLAAACELSCGFHLPSTHYLGSRFRCTWNKQASDVAADDSPPPPPLPIFFFLPPPPPPAPPDFFSLHPAGSSPEGRRSSRNLR